MLEKHLIVFLVIKRYNAYYELYGYFRRINDLCPIQKWFSVNQYWDLFREVCCSDLDH